MTHDNMSAKRNFLLLIGVFVALLVCVYTGLFGMTAV
jgi:hypothetical protein